MFDRRHFKIEFTVTNTPYSHHPSGPNSLCLSINTLCKKCIQVPTEFMWEENKTEIGQSHEMLGLKE
ncbi:hypothetical protein IAQ61_007020 [Plenodomus lingam]|uniref:uncharacterized protein n=1 Tax=Leptosphaeria maculans TaxID=5022 RepID=UPI00331DE9AB|nr:hypothetical protein IAQ61_007020 [Plenodomus lingam]